ncbi:MAG: class I SAM-dependent methyltransferase [Solirubrobacterales bacterium]
MSTHWEAVDYDRVSSPQRSWAEQIFARMELRGDERILDAGCGSGRITGKLAAMVPDGEVVGVDSSEEMIALARERFPDLDLRLGDLLELTDEDGFDLVFSNAVFHWISDHERLFEVLARALRPGGRIEAQCGGYGNVARIKAIIEALTGDARFAEHLAGLTVDWNFARPADTERHLDRAGFSRARAWLEQAPVAPPEPRAYLETVCLRQPLDLLPEGLHAAFVDAVMARTGRRPMLDYVRLNISAQKA